MEDGMRSDFLNPSAWLYLSLQLTLPLPEGSVAAENASEAMPPHEI